MVHPAARGQFFQLGPFHPPAFPERRVRVYAPNPADGRRRPVLYLFDGQNVFEDDGSFSGGWHAHEAIDRLTGPRTVPAPLVVAIPHGGATRQEELTPWPMEGRGGQADRFLDWVVSELDPAVRSAFPVVPGAVGACVGGASWGGLAALYAHYRHPQAFGGALCLSPSFWVGHGAIFSWIAQRPTPPVSRVYLDCGALEGSGHMLPLARRMAEHLASRGYTRAQLWWRPDPRGEHTEAAWRRRLPGALRFMYRRPR